LALALWYYRLTGDQKMAKRSKCMAGALKEINRVFPFYTYRSFYFAPGRLWDVVDADRTFSVSAYAATICQGVEEFTLKERSG
jgi:hypothetical protein